MLLRKKFGGMNQLTLSATASLVLENVEKEDREVQRALELMEQNRKAEAKELAASILKTNGQCLPALEIVASVAEERMDFQEAAKIYQTMSGVSGACDAIANDGYRTSVLLMVQARQRCAMGDNEVKYNNNTNTNSNTNSNSNNNNNNATSVNNINLNSRNGKGGGGGGVGQGGKLNFRQIKGQRSSSERDYYQPPQTQPIVGWRGGADEEKMSSNMFGVKSAMRQVKEWEEREEFERRRRAMIMRR